MYPQKNVVFVYFVYMRHVLYVCLSVLREGSLHCGSLLKFRPCIFSVSGGVFLGKFLLEISGLRTDCV